MAPIRPFAASPFTAAAAGLLLITAASGGRAAEQPAGSTAALPSATQTPPGAAAPAPEPTSTSSAATEASSLPATFNAEPLQISQAISQVAGPSTAQGSGRAAPAGVQRRDGFYIQANFAPVESRGSACDPIGCSTFKTGISGGGAVGYQKNNMRVEVEYMNYSNDFQQSTFAQNFPAGCGVVPGPLCTALAGESQRSRGRAWVQGNALMFNSYYDIPTNNRLRPYIGGGFGVYSGNINNLNLPAFNNALGGAVSSNSILSFAGQIRAGLGYALSNQLTAFLGYRYFKGAGYTYPLAVNGTPIPATIHPNGLSSSSLELGLRWQF